MTQKQIIAMLDRLIERSRKQLRLSPAAAYYLEAFQLVRKNICGRRKPVKSRPEKACKRKDPL